ncbi:gluconolaconase [Rhodanobacter thiooxydans]|uniref:Gluconolaconase n=1 Tax=Rhodanobacter thiooxydans TaxID=416169 RepID=A0A154QEM5_9GAMM|nr:SMP-30/gluconolactonase/LRE family protein [Rhodanobacter thiooxydans]EIL97911.1 SMP-30/gluconolaconase/LRE-like region-containing protein [Rhodanobacter thiooxydans LCS2]KZC22229.1 gluconolaconase [Rhodanobacter thiooxydans]
MNTAAAVALRAGNTLGEGIVWCDREQALYWTDIHAATLWRYRPRDTRADQWAMPERLACIALCEADGWLLLGLASQLAFFHPASGTLSAIATVEAGLPTRLNDGACDRQGRFVFGTLHEPPVGGARQPLGSLYRLNADLSLERLELPGVAISNSVAFSPDGRTLYYCDSPARTIQCCDYGDRCGPSRTFVRLDDPRGEPDGSAVDCVGNLWNAQWGLGRVACYAPNGALDHCVELPASQPTRPAFGGPDLAMLYVTSARDGLDAATLATQPSAGALFAAPAGTTGLPEPRFAGTPPQPSAASPYSFPGKHIA